MNIWLTIRTSIALFLLCFGIGLMFAHWEGQRLMLGAFLAAIGLTFMVRLGLALRQR